MHVSESSVTPPDISLHHEYELDLLTNIYHYSKTHVYTTSGYEHRIHSPTPADVRLDVKYSFSVIRDGDDVPFLSSWNGVSNHDTYDAYYHPVIIYEGDGYHFLTPGQQGDAYYAKIGHDPLVGAWYDIPESYGIVKVTYKTNFHTLMQWIE